MDVAGTARCKHCNTSDSASTAASVDLFYTRAYLPTHFHFNCDYLLNVGRKERVRVE